MSTSKRRGVSRSVGTSKNQERLNAFYEAFPTYKDKVRDWDQLQYLISISPTFRDWYVSYKESISLTSDIPDALKQAGCSPSEWSAVSEEVVETRNSIRKLSQQIDSIARKAKDEIVVLNEKRLSLFKNVHPLIVIANISVSQLPESDQIDLSLLPPDMRSEESKKKIADYQIVLYKNYQDGNFTNPFFLKEE